MHGNPIALAHTAAVAGSPAVAWHGLADWLAPLPFDSASFVWRVPLNTQTFPEQQQLLGTMISDAYQVECRALEDQRLSTYRVPATASMGQSVLIEPEQDYAEADTAFERDCLSFLIDHGLRAGLTIPVVDRLNGCFSALLLSASSVDGAFEAQTVAVRDRLLRAVTYFYEGLVVGELIQREVTLTPREYDCLAYASVGMPTKSIADKLTLSEATVNEYLASATKKLGCRNRTQACVRASLLGYLHI